MKTTGLRTFENAVALVTGGGSGIGAAIGRELARQGATVILADRHFESAQELAGALKASGATASAEELDVRDASAFDRVVARVFATHGRLDYLFNNAGTGVGGEILEYTAEDWKYIVDVNLLGVMYGVQAAYPRMVKQGFGHIVNTASMAGLVPVPLMAVYTSTKHGVVALTRSLRVEGRAYGVRASAFCPGVIRTAILDGGGRYGRMLSKIEPERQKKMFEDMKPMPAEEFARKALKRVAANEEIIIFPRAWRAAWWLHRLAPWLTAKVAEPGLKQWREETSAGRTGEPV